MAQTFSVDFINVQVAKNTSADKKILDKVWSALSWAKNDSKKVHRLSLQAHGPSIANQ